MPSIIRKLSIVALLILLVSNVAFTQSYYDEANLEATEFAIKYKTSTYSSWVKMADPIKVYHNVDEHKIIIFSEVPQILDYGTLRSYDRGEWVQFVALATDTEYIDMEINLYLYKSGLIIIRLVYSDVEYKYKLKLIQ